mmetsp:Transcript_26141/g.32679  ORF Transcript_26141/g.32679 Transcript_26141/m.32679 type:complete len:92 (+) Transcript_26141:325-600(+)
MREAIKIKSPPNSPPQNMRVPLAEPPVTKFSGCEISLAHISPEAHLASRQYMREYYERLGGSCETIKRGIELMPMMQGSPIAVSTARMTPY